MKEIKWNIGIMIIWLGYRVRGGQDYAHRDRGKLMWSIGRYILKAGRYVRGDMPYRTWKWNHI